MRKLVVLEHLTLDGVIQGPGGPDEDRSGGFEAGGWIGPYSDPILGEHVRGWMNRPFDLLLGRKTFDIWAPYWPLHGAVWPEVNAATKYVVSRTLTSSSWQPTVILDGKFAEKVAQLKSQPGPELHVWGSSQLVQALLQHDLIDTFWFMLYPVVLGSGKKLFAEAGVPKAFRATESVVTTKGVVLLTYSNTRV